MVFFCGGHQQKNWKFVSVIVRRVSVCLETTNVVWTDRRDFGETSDCLSTVTETMGKMWEKNIHYYNSETCDLFGSGILTVTLECIHLHSITSSMDTSDASGDGTVCVESETKLETNTPISTLVREVQT